MTLRQMILRMRQGKASAKTVLRFLGIDAENVVWANQSLIQVASAEVDEDEPKVSVTRLAYNADGSETSALGLPCDSVTEEWDAMVVGKDADGVERVIIKDAFDTDELEITDNASSEGLVALAAEIAEVQAQERCLVDGLTGSLVVPGFKMQDPDNLSIMVDGEAVYVEGEVTVDALSDEEVQTKAKMSAEALAEGLGTKAVTVFPMSTEVSYMGTLGGVSVLCDRRKSMAGYSVSGAAEVAWVPVPKSWWDGLGSTVQSALLAVLGIKDRVQSHISDLTTLTVSDGMITPGEGEVTDLSDKSRVFFQVNGGSDRQFAEVGVDGDMQMVWLDNESYVVGILAAVPRVNMQSVLGIAAVCVGIGGGVPGWMAACFKYLSGDEISAFIAIWKECDIDIMKAHPEYAKEIVTYPNVLLDGTEDLTIWTSKDTVRTAAIESCTVHHWSNYLSTTDNKSFTVMVAFNARLTCYGINTVDSRTTYSALYVNGTSVVTANGNSKTPTGKSVEKSLSVGDVITCGNTSSTAWPASGMKIEIIQ